ncbi:MAG TPA: protein kinase, partial [Gemmatimonadales bacterium]|nr:protein kinase [Gemmatimonadales bacterium]
MSELGRRLAADLAPRYTLVRKLGEGGMGMVFEFRDTRLERAVAVKVLKPELASAEAAERFMREARTLAQVSHPNIVPIFDVQHTASGLYCIMMELVQGPTLRDVLEQGPLPATRVREVGIQLLSALEQAHRVGVVHRDVKPSNIFLSGDRVLLGDFGIASSPRRDDETLTRPGQRLGTPPYMSPEQHAALPTGPASDLYACALVLYEALAGQRLAPSAVGDPASWRVVPSGLVAPLRRALELSPAARWPTAAAFREALLESRPLASGLRCPFTLGVAGMVGTLLVIVVWQAIDGASRAPSVPVPRVDLAIGDFREAGPAPEETQIGRYVFSTLDAFPRLEVARFEERSDAGKVARPAFTVMGEVRAVGPDSLRVLLEVHDSTGDLFENIEARGTRASPDALGRAVADSIVCKVFTPECQTFRDVRPIAVNVQAQERYFEGEDAFRRGDWAEAEEKFEQALRLAPHYPIAAWNLMVARRYQRKDFSADLVGMLRQFPGELGSLQRGLAEAQLEPDLFTRFERYRQLVQSYPTSSYALLLYYNERFHRGPLIGIPLAATLDSMSTLATKHTAMHHTS